MKQRHSHLGFFDRMNASKMSPRLLLLLLFFAADLLLCSLVAPFFIDDSSRAFLKPILARMNSMNSMSDSAAGSSSDNVGGGGGGGSSKCDGRRIFIYELPPKFNADLVRACHGLSPWGSMCAALMNSGFGPPISPIVNDESDEEPWRGSSPENGTLEGLAAELWRLAPNSWYATDQFIGEVIYHTRLASHECRTFDQDVASVFYIPFYAGLDVDRYLWSSYDDSRHVSGAEVDRLGLELLDWLSDQPTFRRFGGADHFLASGRVSWDFRRRPERIEDWGSSLFHQPVLKNVTRLIVERSPWEDYEVGVPYPTCFHPRSDATLHNWIQEMSSRPRKTLFAFVGSPRPSIPNDFRKLLLDHCTEVGTAQCRSLDCGDVAATIPGGCSRGPLKVFELFVDATFCLQPRGDSFTRRSVFDAMVAGCIPVFFWNQTAYWQYQHFLPPDPEAYSVFIPHQLVRNGDARIATILAAVPHHRVAAMRETILGMVPSLVYAAPGDDARTFRDAVDVAVDVAVDRIITAVTTVTAPSL